MQDIELIEVLDFIRHAERIDIDSILVECRARAKVLHAQHARDAVATLKPGDRVEVQRLRPKYLCGVQGTVEAIIGEDVRVRFDDDARRAIQRFGPAPKLPAGSLDIIGAAAEGAVQL